MRKTNTLLRSLMALALTGLTTTAAVGGPYTIRVAAPGIKPNNNPIWTVTGSPSTAFGSANVGSYATPDLTIPLRNTGGPGSLGGVAISGANAGDFSQTNNCTTISANANCTMTVRFNPTAAGSRAAAMTIGSTTLNFSGSGVTVPVAPFYFTTCNQSGPTGPTQSACDSAYSGGTLAGLVSVSGGIQSWSVPSTGVYTVSVAGASGGAVTGYTQSYGLGAVITTQLSLTQGTVLKILVGQVPPTMRYVGGGGGGSYVASGGAALAVAGGGGGANGPGVLAGANASLTTTLTNTANWNGNSYGYSGGAGFSVNGNNYATTYTGFGTAYSFVNGGAAASVPDNGCSETESGGFGGGGGGGIWQAGSGGGYSPSNTGSGNGGNSFSSTTISSATIHDGAGYVTITKN